jgi:hypothetical protein
MQAYHDDGIYFLGKFIFLSCYYDMTGYTRTLFPKAHIISLLYLLVFFYGIIAIIAHNVYLKLNISLLFNYLLICTLILCIIIPIILPTIQCMNDYIFQDSAVLHHYFPIIHHYCK